ncbi:MAG: BREX system P-loop protein BrxC [Verrucomicrobia bacterium]|nr:BREX system P-loop protein BrxC [Verrucomicrobiota bacterium]
MKNHELFRRDPKTANLVNDGQVRIINDADDARAITMLRYELEHFVCEGQYAAGLERVLGSFLTNLGSPAQRAAWVSGFYGSGKSHLLKMLCHLWINTGFSDGATARALAPDLPSDLIADFKELDNQGRRTGSGVFAVSGTMPEGSGENARLTVLGIIFRGCGLPSAYNQARFCLFLRDKGYYDKFVADVRAAGRDFRRELTDLYVSPHLRKALIACDAGLGDDREVRELLRSQFPNQTDLDTPEFIRVTREVLRMQGKGEIPLTAIVLDEVQHYIGDDKDRSRAVTELTEALNKQMDSRVLVVAAGQNALSTDTPQFAWLRDRFTIRVELSDSDVETVTRKVLLAKRPEAVGALDADLKKNSGEIERQLVKSSIGPNTRDRDWLVPDYPILPTRRRFWEAALRAVDPTGSSSLLRTQLRITHEALRQVAEEVLGHVVPADFMFFQQQTALVQQGILSREISDRILRLANDGTPSGSLKARVCGLIFLIRKLSRDKGTDTGVRATDEMIADLLVENLVSDGAKLRHELPTVLKELVDAAVLLHDGNEYNLQTRESAEWDDQFRAHLAKIRQDVSAVSTERKARLRAAVDQSLKTLRLQQGVSRTPREIQFHFGLENPEDTGQVVPVWVRDGWEADDKQVLGKAREAGSDSPTIFVFLPQNREEVFRENIIRLKAAQAVLDLKGVPTSAAAEEARDAMEARRRDAERNIEAIVRDILAGAKVYKGGGTELHALELVDKVQDGANDALTRLFPRFGEADNKGWEVAANRARQGDDSPLQAVGWKGGTEEHPVCKEILFHIGAGKEGRHILAHFQRSPFGWDKDSVHGALVCLCASGRLLASDARSGESLAPKQLDHQRIAKASFRTESINLTAKDKIALKGLFQTAGVTSKPDDDLNQKAAEYLGKVIDSARAAGGDAPLPPRPNTAAIEDLRRVPGNEQLAKILEQKSALQQQAGDWKKLAELAEKRLPAWENLRSLLECGSGLDALASVRSSSEAILKDRLLLEASDHVAPLARQAADLIRAALTSSRQVYGDTRRREFARLESADIWKRLPARQRHQLLSQSPVPDADSAPVATEAELVAALRRTPLAQWRDRTDALHGRIDKLLADAARFLEPKAQHVTLPSATIRNADDLGRWLAEARVSIEVKLKDGPVILS